MTKNVTMPNGDVVGFPDEMPDDQIKGMIQKKFPDAGNTRGGDLARGLGHGIVSGLGMGQGAPEGSSGWRQTGEAIGEAIPGIGLSFTPLGRASKTTAGAVTGALQPAKDWKERAENAAIGGGSALIGQGAASYIAKHRTALNALANEAIGSVFGASHLGPWGGLGGLYAGRNVGHLLQNLTGGRGLSDLIRAAANNPGLAAYLGIKASPYASEAGQFVGQELGQPSE